MIELRNLGSLRFLSIEQLFIANRRLALEKICLRQWPLCVNTLHKRAELIRGSLRQRMIAQMKQRGFSIRTHQSYLHAVTELADYHKRSPDTLTISEIQGFFLPCAAARTGPCQYARVSQRGSFPVFECSGEGAV